MCFRSNRFAIPCSTVHIGSGWHQCTREGCGKVVSSFGPPTDEELLEEGHCETCECDDCHHDRFEYLIDWADELDEQDQ